MADQGHSLETEGHASINIGDLSVRCGSCQEYQTLVGYQPRGDWNVYTYECENGRCGPDVTRTLVEVPRSLDDFARRDPTWRGGKKHAGSAD